MFIIDIYHKIKVKKKENIPIFSKKYATFAI